MFQIRAHCTQCKPSSLLGLPPHAAVARDTPPTSQSTTTLVQVHCARCPPPLHTQPHIEQHYKTQHTWSEKKTLGAGKPSFGTKHANKENAPKTNCILSTLHVHMTVQVFSVAPSIVLVYLCCQGTETEHSTQHTMHPRNPVTQRIPQHSKLKSLQHVHNT